MNTKALIAMLLLAPALSLGVAHSSQPTPTQPVFQTQAAQNDFTKIRAQLRAVKDEFIGEGETGEALDSLVEVNKLVSAAKARFRAKNAAATAQLEAKLKQLEAQIRANQQAPFQKTLDEIEAVLKTLEK